MDATAPAAHGIVSVMSFFARPAMAAMAAVLETNPATKPEIRRPYCCPKTRMAQ
jgi:hypothetical protein